MDSLCVREVLVPSHELLPPQGSFQPAVVQPKTCCRVCSVPGHLCFQRGEVQTPQVQQDLHLPNVGLCSGLEPRAGLRSLRSPVDPLQSDSDERDNVTGVYVHRSLTLGEA